MLTSLHPEPAHAPVPPLEPSDVEATHQALAELIEGLIGADSAAFPSRFQALLALMRLHIAEVGGPSRAHPVVASRLLCRHSGPSRFVACIPNRPRRRSAINLSRP